MKKKVVILFVFLYLFPASAEKLTLAELFRSAKNAEVLQIAALETQQAKLAVKESTGAALPKLDAGLYGQFEVNPMTMEDMMPGFSKDVNGIIGAINTIGSINSGWQTIPPFETALPNKWNAFFSAELTQPLFTWGKIAWSIQMAKLGLEAKQIQALGAERELLTKITVQAAQVYYLNRAAQLFAEQEKTAERLKILAEENLANKLILPVDAYGVQILLLELRAAQTQLDAQINSALFALSDYTGITEIDKKKFDFSFIPKDITQCTRMSAGEAVSYARTNGTEAALLNVRTRIGGAQEKIASADAWAKPDVGLKLGFTAGTSAFSSPKVTLRWNFTAAIAINSTIFSGGKNEARAKSARIAAQKNVLERERVLSELEKNLKTLDASLGYKKEYAALYSSKTIQAEQKLAVKYNELQSGYIEESTYLEEFMNVLRIQIQQEQNNLSFFTDYCMYQYLCGKFPDEYLDLL